MSMERGQPGGQGWGPESIRDYCSSMSPSHCSSKREDIKKCRIKDITTHEIKYTAYRQCLYGVVARCGVCCIDDFRVLYGLLHSRWAAATASGVGVTTWATRYSATVTAQSVQLLAVHRERRCCYTRYSRSCSSWAMVLWSRSRSMSSLCVPLPGCIQANFSRTMAAALYSTLHAASLLLAEGRRTPKA